MMAHPSKVGHTLKIQGIPLRLEVDYANENFAMQVMTPERLKPGMQKVLLNYLKVEGFFDKPDGLSCEDVAT